MPANKKPRKAYRPRPAVMPLNMRDNWKIVGSAHAALLALDAGTYDEHHQHALVAFADMCRRIAKPGTVEAIQARGLVTVLFGIQRRSLATGAVMVANTEEATIRAACSVLIEWLEQQPNSVILHAAMTGLREMNRFGGLRVNL